jgi:hypothetical protein
MDAFLRRAFGVIDEHGGLAIASARRTGDDLALEIRVVEPDASEEVWAVTAGDVREHRIEFAWTDGLALAEDHPLLWPHVGEQAQLFFAARPQDPLAMVGRLYERHRRETQGWLPFDRFTNQVMEIGPLLGAGSGLLASGPVRLLTAYAEELAASAVPFSVAGHRPAKLWKPASDAFMAGGQFVVGDQLLKVLTVGDSYVVARSFAAKR